MSQHATTADSGAETTEQSSPDEPDAAALRARIDELERDLSARESQVQALRQRYETILDERETAVTTDEQATDSPSPSGLLTRLLSRFS
ncbi:hypothetical protein [Haloarchaeobius sp. DT45]|uniref:hypothetical protein n=1 Tax=Haloarchaeobius sp. DT45 TaxID=3446116 RepID=UPI003F6C4AF8